MLQVTRQAIDVLRDLIAGGEMAAQGGVHIRLPTVPGSDDDQLEGVELVVAGSKPARTVVLRAGGDIRLFVDLDAVDYLHNKVLHARHDTNGGMRFLIAHGVPPEARGVQAAEPIPET